MKKAGLFVAILLLVCLDSAPAQITEFMANSYSDSVGKELNYRLLKPINYDSTKSYPLVLFLHGAGERGSDNYSQLKWGVSHFAEPKMRKKYPAFVVVPQVPEGQTWSTLNLENRTNSFSVPMREEPTEPMRLSMELLEQLQQDYSIDENRLYVTGISMGGFGTFDLVERHSNKFAAAVPICGGGDATRAFFLKDLPIWVFHGAEDETVPPEYSRTMVSAIRVAGGAPGYTEYPDEGHVGSWVQAYSNPHLYEWLFSKERNEDN